MVVPGRLPDLGHQRRFARSIGVVSQFGSAITVV
jgi:hypothetical protein